LVNKLQNPEWLILSMPHVENQQLSGSFAGGRMPADVKHSSAQMCNYRLTKIFRLSSGAAHFFGMFLACRLHFIFACIENIIIEFKRRSIDRNKMR